MESIISERTIDISSMIRTSVLFRYSLALCKGFGFSPLVMQTSAGKPKNLFIVTARFKRSLRRVSDDCNTKSTLSKQLVYLFKNVCLSRTATSSNKDVRSLHNLIYDSFLFIRQPPTLSRGILKRLRSPFSKSILLCNV